MGKRGCLSQGGDDNLIRSWAAREDAVVIERLQEAFTPRAPGVRFQNAYHGPESAIAGVYTGVADLAWMARETRDRQEIMAYQWVYLEEPMQIEFAHGGLSATALGGQLGVFVNCRNELSSISLTDLDGLLGHECRRGGVQVRRWCQLGSGGSDPDAPVLPYLAPVDDVEMLFIQKICMLNSFKWSPLIRQVSEGWDSIADLVAADINAITILPVSIGQRKLKLVPLSFFRKSESYLPDRETIRNRRYPLTRTRHIITQPKSFISGKPVSEFLRFALSDEGQEIIDTHSELFSLDRACRAGALARLTA